MREQDRGMRWLQVSACAAAVMLSLWTMGAQAATAKADPLHAWIAGDSPATLESWVDERLAAAQKNLDMLVAVKGARTVANTVKPFDDALNQLNLAANQASMMYAVGATAELRDKGQALTQKVAGVITDLNLNQAVFKALAAVPLPSKDAPTKHYLERTLLEYRLAGVDKDAATRAKVKALQDKITASSLVFGRNVQDGTLKVSATRAELAGLPEDYIAKHKPNADGSYTISTDEPDVNPVLDFGSNADLRRRVYLAYNNRAYPANKQVLTDILAARQDLANTLGYPTFADFATADMMLDSPVKVRALFKDVDAASRDTAKKEYQQLLAFAQSKTPGLKEISASDSRYWMEAYRRANYAFDAQSVRPYFAYDQVEKGILDSASKIFQVQFKQVKDAKVWHPSVTTYDVIDRGHRVGRIYLDMHPRDGKDKWFSSAPVVPGIAGQQMPEGMLICNFSGGVAGDPGLMQYREVVTYFHEFGHLMHHILGSQNRWSSQGGFNVEGDFVEAPSQMLEEFFRNRSMVAAFAHNYKTGEEIPADMMQRLNKADEFGRGIASQRQLVFGSLSLGIHDRPVAKVDLDAQTRQYSEQFGTFGYVEGSHFYSAFTHLTGYSSNYYTYILDKVIAIDFFSQFDQAAPLTGSAATRYRKSVIEPGATKPAAELVKDFLGRPQSIDAYKKWIDAEWKK